jgi:hypothetical protein
MEVGRVWIPVVLVYLGFLNASEMVDRGDPFANQDSWESGAQLAAVSREVWNRRWSVNGVPFGPLIKSDVQALNRGAGS